MLPANLTAESFRDYPPQARALAGANLDLLSKLPLAFLPLLLRELIGFDWKFPVEQRELTGQLDYLRRLSPSQLDAEMKPFAALRLAPDLEALDWVNSPARFSEQFSAHLWTTHQIESFRSASVAYVGRLNEANPPAKSAAPRLTLVLLGEGVQQSRYRLFRKLRAHGTYFSNCDTAGSHELFLKLLRRRADQMKEPFSHWHIDGGSISSPTPGPGTNNAITRVSYRELDGPRTRLVAKMRQTMQPGGGGPEALRSLMAQMSPSEIGMPDGGPDGILSRFQVSLLTEGSGTQLFSTTFVQWAARETLRRAQPLTLYARYAPRQREQSMREMLSGSRQSPVPDPEGSLIDADMGAYYTWLNAQRLPGAQESSFLACFDGHREAMGVGPAFTRAAESKDSVSVAEIVRRVG